MPVGPFRSRETGSASGFVCLRVAITTNRGREVLSCLPRPEVRVVQGGLQQPPVMPCTARCLVPQPDCVLALAISRGKLQPLAARGLSPLPTPLKAAPLTLASPGPPAAACLRCCSRACNQAPSAWRPA